MHVQNCDKINNRSQKKIIAIVMFLTVLILGAMQGSSIVVLCFYMHHSNII